MENKETRVVKKMLQYANSICDYCKDIKDAASLSKNTLVAEAVCFDILQIGELAKDGLSDECKASMNIPWPEINGLRNRIVHGYDEINFEIVYETISEDIPFLIQELNRFLQNS